MKKRLPLPQTIILGTAIALFAAFLLFPMAVILFQSLSDGGSFTPDIYRELFADDDMKAALRNSLLIPAASACITTVMAFIPAYAVNYTNIPPWGKKLIRTLVMLPMLLPTITYGFALIYSFGKQGLITRFLGFQLLNVYGVSGLILGYVLYTTPIAFMLINNTMGYIDRKFGIVSRMLGDSRLRCFAVTVLRPLIGTLAVSFIQSFTLAFTDYGIPAALAGNIELLATRLYSEMLGSLPDFHSGSAISVIMLLPSVISLLLITWLKRYNIRYSKISAVAPEKNPLRDSLLALLCTVIILFFLSVFLVVFVVPLVEQWPYRMNFSLVHIQKVFADGTIIRIYLNSIMVAAATAFFGTLIAYGTALLSARGGVPRSYAVIPDSISLVANTIPGMVLGVAYLLSFRSTALHNSFAILIICNIVHYFSSPYLMMKSGLEKLNASWETTARLMGDSWLKTVLRILTPNALPTIVETFSYFFVNALLTISAVVFLVSTRTMVLTAKIKELQHFANFNEIFVLSILIMLTNLLVKTLTRLITKRI